MAEVTRSLSNLLKSRNIKCDNNEKKVIDYNDIITEKIAQIQKKIEEEHQKEEINDGFVEGIDAESVEKLLSEDSNVIRENNSANEKAEEIIALAKNDAQAILDKAKDECESLKHAAMESGRNEGYQEGKVQAAKEVEFQRQELENEKKRLEEEYEKKVKQIEPELVDVILNVFEKVTHVLAEDKKELVLQLVEDVLAKNEFSTDLLIRVSSADYKFVMDNRDKINSAVRGKVQVEITEDPTFKKGQCMIESDSGIYDCSLDIQLENLVDDIKILSCMAE